MKRSFRLPTAGSSPKPGSVRGVIYLGWLAPASSDRTRGSAGSLILLFGLARGVC